MIGLIIAAKRAASRREREELFAQQIRAVEQAKHETLERITRELKAQSE